jgi:repressor LexA
MIGDGILDGDYVIIRKQDSAENGETVVALIDNEATIKRYQRRKGGGVELHAANPAYPTIHVDPERRFRIEGILAGLIRRWS